MMRASCEAVAVGMKLRKGPEGGASNHRMNYDQRSKGPSFEDKEEKLS